MRPNWPRSGLKEWSPVLSQRATRQSTRTGKVLPSSLLAAVTREVSADAKYGNAADIGGSIATLVCLTKMDVYVSPAATVLRTVARTAARGRDATRRCRAISTRWTLRSHGVATSQRVLRSGADECCSEPAHARCRCSSPHRKSCGHGNFTVSRSSVVASAASWTKSPTDRRYAFLVTLPSRA